MDGNLPRSLGRQRLWKVCLPASMAIGKSQSHTGSGAHSQHLRSKARRNRVFRLCYEIIRDFLFKGAGQGFYGMLMPYLRAVTTLTPFKSSKVSQLSDQKLEHRKRDANDEDVDDEL
jgi:hypothetical protein